MENTIRFNRLSDALMYAFIRVDGNVIRVANRIFEMLLYNYYLSESELKNPSMSGNYCVESRTRNNKRIDIVIDYLGERFVVELKIWRGNAYNERGEE